MAQAIARDPSMTKNLTGSEKKELGLYRIGGR